MKVVNNRIEVVENLYLLYKYTFSENAIDKEFAYKLLKSGWVFVAVNIGGKLFFAPSRFIGYSNNNIARHDKNEMVDGRETNVALSKIYGNEEQNNYLLEEFKRYLNNLGIERNYETEKIIRFYFDNENIERKEFSTYFICPTHLKGKKPEAWENFKQKNIAAIGWDLPNYDGWSWSKVEDFLKEQGYKDEADALNAHKNLSNINIGDLICATNNNHGLFGIGIACSKRKFEIAIHDTGNNDGRDTYDHYVDVAWVINTYIPKNVFTNFENEKPWEPYGTLKERNPIPRYIKKIFFKNLLSLNIDNPKNKNMNSLNTILYGPPGTGKTYNTVNKALEIVGYDVENNDRKTIKAAFDKYVKEGQIVFTTFHQSMSYEDFIEGIKPLPPVKGEPIKYDIVNGIFKELCTEASKNNELQIKLDEEENELTKEIFEDLYYSFSATLPNHTASNSNVKLVTIENSEFELFNNKIPVYKSYEQIIIDKILEDKSFTREKSTNTSKQFVIIIDEINRGNVSQIFGELITLIEDDKRIGNKEELKLTLPYSKKEFGVPPNLYIIGTMNTADRSVEALDTALRRRFVFEEMMPKPELLADLVIEDIKLQTLLETINSRIEVLLNRDNLIGHSYFMNVKSIDNLKSTLQNKIIPLLQEYFFGDYGKIGLVLGEGFFEEVKSNERNIFSKFDDYDTSSFDEKKIYQLKNMTSMNEVIFKDAIKKLYQVG